MKKIALLGFIGSGKGTTARYLVENHKYNEYSFAKPVKDLLSVVFGWDRALLEGDTPESRKFREKVDHWWAEKLGIVNFSPRMAMTLIGTDMFRNNLCKDIWILNLLKRIQNDDMVIVSDARFPNEIQALRDDGFVLVRVDGNVLPEWVGIAARANAGCSESRSLMLSKYSYVHVSEWAWVGTKVDHVLNNNSTISDLHKKIELIVSQ